jgi:LuxR family maltose regulon positive regulatory protein
MATAKAPPTTATKLLAPELRPESIPRGRLSSVLQDAAERPLTVICAPAGYGKTTALVQWLEYSDVEHAWLSLDAHDNDPRWFAARLLAALDRALPGQLEASERALHAGSDLGDTVIPLAVNALAERSGKRLAMVLEDYHLISDKGCHRLTRELIDALPAGVGVIVTSRTTPPLRLGRRRAAGTVAEIGPEQLRFELEESALLLNGSLELGLDREQIELIDERVQGWAAGLALIATALAGRRDRAGFLDALARSRTSLDAYLAEEVLEAARPALRDFLCRTSILGRLSGPLCEAVLDDPQARDLLEEVRRMNLFVTTLDPEGAWLRYHPVFAETLTGELERREPELMGELHRRASEWFEEAGMPDEAIEHALVAGDGPRAASLLAASWLALITDRRYATVRRILDRLPDERGEFGPLCDALDLLCMIYEGVDQRLVCKRAEALGRAHGDDPGVRLLVDSMLISPFYGDVSRAVEIGREAWARYADAPDVQVEIGVLFALVLWFAGDYDEVRRLLEPRVLLEQPALARVWTLAILAMTAGEEGDAELAESYAREAMAEVEAIGGETATEFTGVPWVLGEALRLRGKLEEARRYLDRGLANEGRRPGSVGHAVALVSDAQLALAEGNRRRARRSARRASAMVDRYRDLGTIHDRVASVEAALEAPADNPLLGSRPTPAELRVLRMLDSDRTFAEIASELYVSRDTVKSHARRLYRRLGETTRKDAVAAARERGLLG